jgi:uncharacterized repeat protein (TIGR03803 family)
LLVTMPPPAARALPLLFLGAILCVSRSAAQIPSYTLATLHIFTGTDYAGPSDGAYPSGPLLAGPHGQFFGTTSGGGIAGAGAVYELAPPTAPGGPWIDTLLYSFHGGPDGGSPEAGVVIGTGGALYGTTYFGGGSNVCLDTGCGAVFELAPPASPGGTWTETGIYGFTGRADGAEPNGALTVGKNGTFYGTASGGGVFPCMGQHMGCGTVFELTPPASPGGAWTETVLYSFTGQNGDGAAPFGNLIMGKNGALYGTTSIGGAASAGTVFELRRPSAAGDPWTETIIYNFPNPNGFGSFPTELSAGADEALYGVTSEGGAPGGGTVYRLAPPTVSGGAWTETDLYAFKGPPDGFLPSAAVVTGKNGAIYGTTSAGGPAGGGTVFELSPPAAPGQPWTETILAGFSGENNLGTNPAGPVIIGKDGIFYGTTETGPYSSICNKSGCGTLFALVPASQ